MPFRIEQLNVLNLATVGNSITAGSFVKSGGTSSQFLKADGSVDSSAYITGITSGMVTTALGYTPVPTTRTLTINGTAYDLSADRSWTISVPVSSVSGSGAGISVSPTTGAVVVSNTGVTSNVAGTGISVSSATGAVTITNTGVTSIVAGTAISISGATGAVTINNTGVTSLNGGTGAITGIATTAQLAGYLPLSGGTITGTLAVNSDFSVNNTRFTVNAATGNTVAAGSFTANSIIKSGGTSSQFLKADGSVDSNSYVTGGPYLPTAGGTMTGLITSTVTDEAFRAQSNGTSTAWRGRLGSFNSTADKSSFLGNYTGRPGVFGHNNALTAWAELYVNTLGIYGQGTLYLSWDTYVKGNGNDTNYPILHSGNYNSYAPTLTGGGASGTWGISISGNAATATNANTVGGVSASQIVYGNTTTRRGTWEISNWNQTTYPDVAFLSSENGTANAPTSDYSYGLQYSFHRSGAAYRTQMVTSLYSDLNIWVRNSRDSDVWTAWKVLLHSGNYNSYAPTLTGGGASGTWGINITGTAGSETLQTVTSRGASTTSTLTSTNVLGLYVNSGSYSYIGINSASNWAYISLQNNGSTSWDIASYAGGSLEFRPYGSNGNRIAMTLGGNLGVGTVNPSGRLHVYQGSATDTYLESGTGGTTGKLIFKTSDNSDLNKYIMQDGYWTVIGTHSNEGLRVRDSGGNILINIAGSTNGYPNRVGIGNTTPSYKLHVSGDIYADGGWLRVSGTAGLYFESYGGGWRMTDSSYIRTYNNKALSMEGASVDYVGSIYMNGGVYIQTNNNRNLQVTSSGAGDNGIYGRGNSGQFCYQIYGDGGGNYGFLNSVWGAWDLKKNVGNGNLYMNDNNTYYLNTNGTSYLYRVDAADQMRAPIFYDSDNTAYYLNPASSSTSLRIAGGIAQNDIVGRPAAYWGAGGSTTGAVVIKFPGNTGNYGMVHAVIDIYEYNGNDVCTVIVGGHNWGSAWYSYGAQVVGTTDKPVRVGVKDGKYCIVIGNGSSSWSYGQVVLRKIQNGTYYSGVMDIAGGYTAAIESDTYSWISGDLRNLETPVNFYAGGNIYMGGNIVATQSWVNSQGFATGGPFVPVSGGVNMTGSYGLNDNKLYLRTNGDNNHYLWNAGDDWEELNAYEGTGFRITSVGGSVGVLYVYGSSNGGYTYSPYSFRAPIFYDSDNTAYYANFADSGTSVNIAGKITTAISSGTIISHGAMTDAFGYNGSYGTYIGSPVGGTYYIYANGTFYDAGTIRTFLHSGNYSSYAIARGGDTVDGIIYYRTNLGAYSGSLSGARLQVYNDNNQSAFMSFHRSGQYAVNFGLDQDNVLRIGGWSAAADRWVLDMSGNNTVAGSFRAPIFYDSQNTAYFCDPASTSNLVAITTGATGVYNLFQTWTQLNGYHGFYSSLNGSHLYVNNGTYGSWRMAGSRNGWNGIEFDASNGQVVMMINNDSNTSGFHNNSYGWHFRWNNGTAYVYKNAYGGGTAAVVLDSSNYNSYSPTLTGGGASGTWSISITGNASTVGGVSESQIVYGGAGRASNNVGNMNDTNQKSGLYYAYDPTGRPYAEWWNWITIAGNGWQSSNNYEFQLAHCFHDDGFYVRRMTNGTVYSWRYILTDSNSPYAYNMNQYVRTSDSPTFSSVYTSNWFRAYGDTGLYSQDYGSHLRRTVNASHGTWEIFGYNKGGYAGLNIYDPGGYNNNYMHEYGNGGLYQQNGYGWIFYWYRPNSCLGIGTSTTSGSYRMYVNGGIYSTGDVVAYSDRRKKIDIVTIDNALEKVTNLRGVFYTKIGEEEKGRKTGVIAQEINEVLPEVVTYAADVDEYGVAYGNIAGVLIEAIKEQNELIKTLKSEIDELKSRLD